MLGGGVLTGKFNQPGGPGEADARQPGEREGAGQLAAALGQVAAEIGRTPSQVAINWVRQQARTSSPSWERGARARSRTTWGCWSSA